MLIDDPKKEPTRQKGWRLRASAVEYIEKRTKGAHRGAEAQVVEDAIFLHRALHDSLGDDVKLLQRFAADEGLNLTHDSGAVIARLARTGLEAYEKSRKK